MIGRIAGLLAIAWALGFALFMLVLPKPVENVRTDAIVVPTGGAGRIDRGLALLAAHQAQRMFVSGVAPEVRASDLAGRSHADPALFACCVDLGREAVDTRSNAEEIGRWVRAHRYRSVRLVTSDWHLARARLELHAVLGDDVVVIGDGVPGSPAFSLLISEYNKFLWRRVALWFGIG